MCIPFNYSFPFLQYFVILRKRGKHLKLVRKRSTMYGTHDFYETSLGFFVIENNKY